MKKSLSLRLQVLIFVLFIAPLTSMAQSYIRGTVKDSKGTPIEFVNVFIKNSTDGSLTDSLGRFKIGTNGSVLKPA